MGMHTVCAAVLGSQLHISAPIRATAAVRREIPPPRGWVKKFEAPKRVTSTEARFCATNSLNRQKVRSCSRGSDRRGKRKRTLSSRCGHNPGHFGHKTGHFFFFAGGAPPCKSVKSRIFLIFAALCHSISPNNYLAKFKTRSH